MKYYTIKHLLHSYPDARYYMAFGERSNGKTYSSLELSLENFVSNGKEFAYLRRFGEDIRRKNLASLFSGICDNGVVIKLTNGEFTGIRYGNGRFYLVNNENGTELCCGYAFDLNSMEHYKSLSYPKVNLIIFDEFISRQGYLPNEFVLFMNTLSTIIRERSDVKIIMLGNTVSRYCPYFDEMGLLHVKSQEPGTVDVYTYGESGLQVVVEYCSPTKNKGGKPSDIYFAFDNPQLQMITTGGWELAMYPRPSEKIRPKDIIMVFFIEFNDDVVMGQIVVTETSYFLFFSKKTTPIKQNDCDIVYTSRPAGKWNYRVGLNNQKDKLSLYILKLLNENRVFYSDNETGEMVRSYLKWSVTYCTAKGG